MREKLIKGLIYAFAGILIFVSSTKIPIVNNIMLKGALFVAIAGIALFIYSGKLAGIKQQLAYTLSTILMFRGLISISQVDDLITRFPIWALLIGFGLFYVTALKS